MYTTAQISAFNIFIEAIHQPQASQSNERVNTSTSMPSSKAKGSCDGSVFLANSQYIVFFQSSPPVRSVKRIMATDIGREEEWRERERQGKDAPEFPSWRFTRPTIT
ncbi:hypothetical protein GQX74_015231 [Glossina fuscipes]|nr:hypothetical protein GQX74_015231 [Glossina fuscipes]